MVGEAGRATLGSAFLPNGILMHTGALGFHMAAWFLSSRNWYEQPLSPATVSHGALLGVSGSPGAPDLHLYHPPDQHILRELEKKKILVFTPSRRVGGKRVVCYDDRFIVKLAYESDGVVVSNDTYRDLQGERQEWKRFIEERLLMYSFVNDKYVTAGGLGTGRDTGGGLCGPMVWVAV